MSDPTRNDADGKDAGPPAAFLGRLHRTDLGITAVLLAVCAALWYETTTWDTVPAILSQNIPPTFFPRVLLGCIVVLALMLPFESAHAERQGTDLDEDRRNRIKPITYVTALGLIAIVVLFEWLGTDLSMVLACVLLPILWGERRVWVILPFAIVFPAAVHWVFVEGLQVHFLPGLLEPWLG